jgi:TolA-binding protein
MHQSAFTKYTFILLFVLFTPFVSFAQRTAGNEERIKLYNNAMELYDKQLYNAAISIFMDYLPYANDAVNSSDVVYYIASCKLKLMHQNGLANMLDFIQRHPQSRKVNNANLEVGDYYYNTTKFRTAISFYKKVNPMGLSEEEKQTLSYRKGYCFFKTAKFKEAKDEFYPLTTTENPYTTEATYYYGYVSYMNKDYKEALKAFKKVEDKKEEVKLYIAEIYYLQNEYQKAVDYASGKNFEGLNKNRDMLLGKCYYRLKNYDKALEYFEKSNYKLSDLNNAEAYEIGYSYFVNKNCIKSSELFEKIANTGDVLAQSASYNLGECFLKVGKKQNAFNAFYEAQRTDFDKTIQEESMYAYAKLAHELDYNNKAIAAYQKFIESFPKSTYRNEARKNLANILLSANDYKAAISVLDDMTMTDQSTRELYQKVLFLRAQELYLQRDFANAELMFKKSIANKVDNDLVGESYFWLGEMDYKQRKDDEARFNYQRFLENAESKKTKYYPDALYAIGYTYFNQKKYQEAAIYFNRYKTSVGYTLPENMFHDATLRLGDCYFSISDYNAALDAYSYIVSNKKTGADYAMFQQGMIYGLQNKSANKIAILKKISRDFPNSPYIPEAIYQTAREYFDLDNYKEAERYYRYLIDDYPNSSLAKNCYESLGSIYYIQGDYSNALTQYKYIAKTYPGTPEAQKAIRNAESVYKKQGNIKEYVEWVKSLPNVNISTTKEDSLYFDAAYRLFMNKDYSKASVDFEDYLKNFSSGFFIFQSNYYAAMCYLNLSNEEKALTKLKFIADNQISEFKEDALDRLSAIYKKNDDCANALPYFELLERFSTNNANLKKSLMGQISCNNLLGNREKAKTKSELLLKYDRLTNVEFGESNNTIAKYYLHDSMYKSANAYFAKTLKNQQDVYAAEAKYFQSYMFYMQDSLDKCRKNIMEFNNQFNNYDFWLGKTFILLSDFYIKKGDKFQAKATLNSVLENFDDAEILRIAKLKLEALEPKSNSNELLNED